MPRVNWLETNDVLVISQECFYDPDKVEIVGEKTHLARKGGIERYSDMPLRCVVLSVAEDGSFNAIWSPAEHVSFEGRVRILAGQSIHVEIYRNQNSNYARENAFRTSNLFQFSFGKNAKVVKRLDPHELLQRSLDGGSIDLACIFRGQLAPDTLILSMPEDEALNIGCKIVVARIRLQNFINNTKKAGNATAASEQEFRYWHGAAQLDGVLFRLVSCRLKAFSVLPNLLDDSLLDPVLYELRSIYKIYKTEQDMHESITAIYEAVFDTLFPANRSILGELSNAFNYDRDAQRQLIYAASLLDFWSALDIFCQNKPADPGLVTRYPKFMAQLKVYQEKVYNPQLELDIPIQFPSHKQTKQEILDDMARFASKYAVLINNIAEMRSKVTVQQDAVVAARLVL